MMNRQETIRQGLSAKEMEIILRRIGRLEDYLLDITSAISDFLCENENTPARTILVATADNIYGEIKKWRKEE